MYKGKDIAWQDRGNSLEATINNRTRLVLYNETTLSVVIDGIERAKLHEVDDANEIASFVSDIIDSLSEE